MRTLVLAIAAPALMGLVRPAPRAPAVEGTSGTAGTSGTSGTAVAAGAVGAPLVAGGAVITAEPEWSAGRGPSAVPFDRGGAPVPASAPVRAPAAAETVLVARRDLPRGVAITATDFDVVVNASPARPPRGERPGLGWVTRRVVRKGEPLRPPAVAPPPIVHSGSPVTVVWLVDGIRVTREGTALGTAHAGERVVVRVDAQRRVTGTATGPGLVTVAP